jgi:hypothetical protein
MIFTPAMLGEFTHAQPFVPFHLETTTGKRYLINHPELIWIGRQYVTIGLLSEGEERYFDRQVLLPLLHPASIEPVPRSTVSPADA